MQQKLLQHTSKSVMMRLTSHVNLLNIYCEGMLRTESSSTADMSEVLQPLAYT